MTTRFLQRSGTAAEWSAANPVLAPGEIGYATDTGVVKVGNGVDAWDSLRETWLDANGGTMHGPLHVPVPTQDYHAVPKSYLDPVDADLQGVKSDLNGLLFTARVKASLDTGTLWSIGAGTDIEFDVLDVNVGGFSLDANGRVVMPRSGLFVGQGTIGVRNSGTTSTGVRRLLWCKKYDSNSVALDPDPWRWEWGMVQDEPSFTFSIFARVNAGDRFGFRGYSGGSGSVNFHIVGGVSGSVGFGTYLEGVLL